MTSVDTKHPDYAEFLPDWVQLRDTYDGQRRIKEKGLDYLPATGGMIADGMNASTSAGTLAYEAYKQRAVFPSSVADAVQSLVGAMWHKPPVIEVPDPMRPMLETATTTGESVEALLRRVNEEQLVTGRVGLLLDFDVNPDIGTVMPRIAMYSTEAIINWDTGRRGGAAESVLRFVVLDESGMVRAPGGLAWTQNRQFRVLALGDLRDPEPGGVYQVAVVEGTGGQLRDELYQTPVLEGRPLREIPFVFINAKDVIADPHKPPLLRLSDLALTIYRGEADYRQSLFMQGQDTLVTMGEVSQLDDDEQRRTGAGAEIRLPLEGDAKYIGVDSSGLPEQRQALENDMARASAMGGQLLDNSRQKESGEALGIRVAASTASLNTVALAGAMGLENLLKTAARWMNLNEDEVSVMPNLDFAQEPQDSAVITEIISASGSGSIPLSRKSMHRWLVENEWTDMDYEEEEAQIEAEGEGQEPEPQPALGLVPPATA